MCRRPSQPRQPSDSQIVFDAAGSAAAAETQADTGTANTTERDAATTNANPVIDMLTLADALLLSRRNDHNENSNSNDDSSMSAARAPALRPQMTEEQRNEISRLEWERLHPVMGVLQDDEDELNDEYESSLTATPSSTEQPAAAAAGRRRRRPRRSPRGAQGKRLSVEAHPLKLIEELSVSLSSVTTDQGDTERNAVESTNTGVRPIRSGRRRVRRAQRSASEDSTESTANAHANFTKQ